MAGSCARAVSERGKQADKAAKLLFGYLGWKLQDADIATRVSIRAGCKRASGRAGSFLVGLVIN